MVFKKLEIRDFLCGR